MFFCIAGVYSSTLQLSDPSAYHDVKEEPVDSVAIPDVGILNPAVIPMHARWIFHTNVVVHCHTFDCMIQ